jgi:hypothetical protein
MMLKCEGCSSPFTVSSMATTGRCACSFVHPIGDVRLTAAKRQTTLAVRVGAALRRGVRTFTPRLCRGEFEVRVRDLTRAAMLDSCITSRVSGSVVQCIWLVFTEVKSAGCEMNFHWARSEKFLLAGLALSAAIVGLLTILVITQESDPSTVANTPASTAPQPARGPTAPPLAPAPPMTAPSSPPAQVTTPTQLAPPSAKPLKAATLPRRRSNPVPAPPPVAAAPPSDPAPAVKPGSPDGWDPVTPARSNPAVKPGSPDGG